MLWKCKRHFVSDPLTAFPTPTWPLCLNSFSVNLTTSADTEAFSLDLIIRSRSWWSQFFWHYRPKQPAYRLGDKHISVKWLFIKLIFFNVYQKAFAKKIQRIRQRNGNSYYWSKSSETHLVFGDETYSNLAYGESNYVFWRAMQKFNESSWMNVSIVNLAFNERSIQWNVTPWNRMVSWFWAKTRVFWITKVNQLSPATNRVASKKFG